MRTIDSRSHVLALVLVLAVLCTGVGTVSAQMAESTAVSDTAAQSAVTETAQPVAPEASQSVASETAQSVAPDAAQAVTDCGVLDQPGAYELSGNLSGTAPCIEIASDDVSLAGNGHVVTAADPGAAGAGLLVSASAGVDNATVANLTLRDWGTGVSLSNVTGVALTNITVANASGTGVGLTDGGSNTSDEVDLGVTVTDSGGPGIAIEGNRHFANGTYETTSNVTVADSTVTNSSSHGIHLTGDVLSPRVTDTEVRDTAENGIYAENSLFGGTVDSATVENSGTHGIRVESSPDWLVANNSVTGIAEFDSAIQIYTAEAATVRDNDVTGVINFFAGSGSVARNNTVTDSAWDGLRLGAEDLLAVDNTVESVERTGIATAGTAGTNATVRNNTVLDSGSRAVSSDGEGGHRFVDNHFDGGPDGLRFFDANNTVRDNYVANFSDYTLDIAGSSGAHSARILDNTFEHNAGDVITVDGANDSVVRNNTIRDPTFDGTGIVASGANLTVTENRVTDLATGIDLTVTGTGEAATTVANNTLEAVGDGITVGVPGNSATATVDSSNNTVQNATGVGIALSAARGGQPWNETTFVAETVTNASTPLRIENGAGATVESLTVDTITVDVAGGNLTVAAATPSTIPEGLASTGAAVDVQPVNGTSAVTTLGLAYDDAAVADFPEDSLSVWRHDGAAWADQYNTTVDTAANRATVTESVTSFGTFGLYGAGTATLSVDDVASEFPDAVAPADYGTVEIPVGETDDVATENLTVTLTVADANGTLTTTTNDSVALRNETVAVALDAGVVDEAGTYNATVTADADNADPVTATETFRVDAPATASLSALDVAGVGPEATITAGTAGDVTANVTNAGDVAGSFDVTLTIGTAVTETRTTGTLAAGATETVAFENVTAGLPVDVAGYAVTVAAGGSELAGTLTVSVDGTGDGQPARDTTGDGLLNDVNGDDEFSVFDVQTLFANLDRDAIQNHPALFDFQGKENPESVTVFDVQALFADL